MSLWMILYTAGHIGGVIGPLPYGTGECIVRRDELRAMQTETLKRGTDYQTGLPLTDEQRAKVADVAAECEYRANKPVLGDPQS